MDSQVWPQAKKEERLRFCRQGAGRAIRHMERHWGGQDEKTEAGEGFDHGFCGISEGKRRQGRVSRFSSVQFGCSVISDSLRPHELQHARPPCPSSTPGVYPNPCPLSRWCHPTILSSVVPFSCCPQSFPDQGLFKWVALRIRWPKYWSFSFNISPSNDYSGLISFRMDWLDLRAVQGTLKSLLQYHSSKASILRCSAFFIVQLSHPYMTTGKTIALTRRTFVDKVM